ncbi:MAG: hypothetical protein WA376_14990, partial [Terrimicrobiaceae bacterium]
CRSGQRAYYATRILLQHGFKARNLSGGLLSRAILSERFAENGSRRATTSPLIYFLAAARSETLKRLRLTLMREGLEVGLRPKIFGR